MIIIIRKAQATQLPVPVRLHAIDDSNTCRVGQLHEPDLMVLRAGGRQRLVQEKVYIENLHISQLQITLSFVPSPGTWPAPPLDQSSVHTQAMQLHCCMAVSVNEQFWVGSRM